MLSLRSDMEELITLTRESLESAKGARSNNDDSPDGLSDDDDDPMAKEYAMFKVQPISQFFYTYLYDSYIIL